jgi:Secretion system C-terminal sorting domain
MIKTIFLLFMTFLCEAVIAQNKQQLKSIRKADTYLDSDKKVVAKYFELKTFEKDAPENTCTEKRDSIFVSKRNIYERTCTYKNAADGKTYWDYVQRGIDGSDWKWSKKSHSEESSDAQGKLLTGRYYNADFNSKSNDTTHYRSGYDKVGEKISSVSYRQNNVTKQEEIDSYYYGESDKNGCVMNCSRKYGDTMIRDTFLYYVGNQCVEKSKKSYISTFNDKKFTLAYEYEITYSADKLERIVDYNINLPWCSQSEDSIYTRYAADGKELKSFSRYFSNRNTIETNYIYSAKGLLTNETQITTYVPSQTKTISTADYTYDSRGNISTELYKIDGEVSDSFVHSYQHDANGLLLSAKKNNGDSIINYQYDCQNNITKITKKTKNTLSSTQFDYYEIPDCITLENTDYNVPFGLFPNPVHDILNVRFLSASQATELTIYDAQGRLFIAKKLSESDLSEEIKFDISALLSGVYFVRSLSSGKVVTKRFLKL